MTPPRLRLGPVFAGATAVAGAVAAIAAILDVVRTGSDLESLGVAAVLVVACALSRRAGVPLAGGWFSSLALGAPIYVTLARGWAPAVLVGIVGVTVGDWSF